MNYQSRISIVQYEKYENNVEAFDRENKQKQVQCGINDTYEVKLGQKFISYRGFNLTESKKNI
jgi:hypothetical protein